MADFEILCFGETMAMFVAEQPGELDRVEQFGKRIAGADSNVAIGLARLGFAVAWLSRVGDDSLGRFVLDSLTREGLDCRFVEVDAQAPTGFQMKSREVDGADPRVEYFRRGSAASRLGLAHIREEMLGARHLHATGIPPALSASACELSHELMRRMRGKGASLSFDPNLRPSLWPSERRMIAEINALAAHAHWVLPGLEEGRLLSGWQEPADIAAFYLDMGVDAVAIKLGPSGAYYRDAHGEGLVPGVPVATVVDTVGAGDGFAVGVVSALLEGLPLPDAVARGNWIGSRAVQVRGDMEGCRNAANCSTASAARAPEPAAHAAPVATRTRQAQEIPTMTMPRLASSRWWYIMPIVFVTYSLAYLDRANYGFAAASGWPTTCGSPRAVLAAGRAVLPRLLLLPGAGGDLRGKAQRQEADLRQPDPLGRAGHPDRDGRQRLPADRHPLPPRRGRGGGDAGDAGLPLPLVHPRRALAGEYLPDPRQPGDHPLDVGGLRLPGGAFQLALDVHHRACRR